MLRSARRDTEKTASDWRSRVGGTRRSLACQESLEGIKFRHRRARRALQDHLHADMVGATSQMLFDALRDIGRRAMSDHRVDEIVAAAVGGESRLRPAEAPQVVDVVL